MLDLWIKAFQWWVGGPSVEYPESSNRRAGSVKILKVSKEG
jgi:hypothetical protein